MPDAIRSYCGGGRGHAGSGRRGDTGGVLRGRHGLMGEWSQTNPVGRAGRGAVGEASKWDV